MHLALAAVIVFLSQFVEGVTGFGSALVAVPVLAWLYGPVEAIALQTLCDLLAGTLLVRGTLDLFRPKLLAAAFAPLVVGQWIGTDLVVLVPPEIAGRTIALVVALFAIDLLIRPVRAGRGEHEDLPDPPHAALAGGALAGALAGLFHGMIGAPGPPIVLYARALYADRFFRAFAIQIFLLAGISLTATLAMKQPESLASAATRLPWMLPSLFAGTATGAWLAPRVPRAAFSRGLVVHSDDARVASRDRMTTTDGSLCGFRCSTSSTLEPTARSA